MKKVISILLLSCFITIFIPQISASNNTTYFDEATIITPNSFSQIFSTNHIDEVTYEYDFEILQNNNTEANVTLQIELKINNQTYNLLADGVVDSYQLNDGDILWEGPLDSAISINNEYYTVIVGFALLSSSQDTMISLTIQNDSTMIAISFGENIIRDSVLDLFLQQNGGNNTNNIPNINIDDSISNSQFNDLNPEDTYSPNAPPSNFSEVMDPGCGTLNLGPNGEWKYQSLILKKHGNSSYNAMKSAVYFDDSRNILMVTLTPYSEETNNYVNTLGYDFASSSLNGFKVELILEDIPAESYAHIEYVDVPNDIPNTDDYFSGNTRYLSLLFEDFISVLGVPTSTISAILNELKGKIESQGQGLSAYVDIEKDLFSDYRSLDNLPYGLPFRFQLSKGNEQNYVGNTPYTVNLHAKYFVLAQHDVFMYDPIYYRFYIETSTTHQGEITLS